jgi:hypothetical protein
MLTGLPPTRWPTASGEARAATSATAAATRNNEQKIRRHGDDTDVRWGFLIIELRFTDVSLSVESAKLADLQLRQRF